MNAITRLLFLPILVSLAVMPFPASGDFFFPNGRDGYIIDGETITVVDIKITNSSPCKFVFKIPPGKKVLDFDLWPLSALSVDDAVAVLANGEGALRVVTKRAFSPPVDENGNPCNLAALAASATPVAAGAEAPISIPISNDADSLAITCDGRFAVVVGANSATPISLVDFVARAEVDKFAAESNATYATTFDDGESVVVVLNIPPPNDSNRLRRLKIVNGKLVDTGEDLLAGTVGTNRLFKKVFPVVGSKIGVALMLGSAPGLVTFSVPGLQVLSSINAFGDSAAVSCAGDKVYVRKYSVRDGGQINGYTLDPLTGALGATPFLTITVGQTDFFVSNFGNALAISRDGTRLIVPEGTGFPNSPPTPRVTFFDTTTGARLGFFDAFGGGSPTLVSTYSCCAGTGLRLGVQRLTSGLIQITATGETGRRYELQKSQYLVAWDKLLEFQMMASSAPYTDPDSRTNSTRFYRLKLLP